MVTIYGYSDDLVVVEHSEHGDHEIDCYDKEIRFRFTDGTVIRIGYGKENLGVWYIERENVGTAEQTLLICEDEDADPYSDVFSIDAEIESHEVLRPLCLEEAGYTAEDIQVISQEEYDEKYGGNDDEQENAEGHCGGDAVSGDLPAAGSDASLGLGRAKWRTSYKRPVSCASIGNIETDIYTRTDA